MTYWDARFQGEERIWGPINTNNCRTRSTWGASAHPRTRANRRDENGEAGQRRVTVYRIECKVKTADAYSRRWPIPTRYFRSSSSTKARSEVSCHSWSA
jgi:hypothetical protein